MHPWFDLLRRRVNKTATICNNCFSMLKQGSKYFLVSPFMWKNMYNWTVRPIMNPEPTIILKFKGNNDVQQCKVQSEYWYYLACYENNKEGCWWTVLACQDNWSSICVMILTNGSTVGVLIGIFKQQVKQTRLILNALLL